MIKDISSDKKVEILISALEERYQAMHKIRERVQSTGIWFLGITLAVSGWLIQSNIYFSCIQKIIYILATIIAYIAVRFYYLEDLNIGFKGQQRTAAKLEKALGFFTSKHFNDSDDPIYPLDWEKAGTNEGKGKFFNTSFMLINIGIIFLILTIITNGCFYM